MVTVKVQEIQKLVETLDGWLSFAEGNFLYKSAKSCSGHGAVVEIGSWKGKSTIWLAHGLKDGKGGSVYAIDPHTGAPEHHEIFGTKDIWTFEDFKENIKKAGIDNFVSPIVDRSENIAKNWNEKIELLWIDGAHSFEAAQKDFDSWFPHLMEGGIVAYHDATYDDVRRVIKDNILFSKNFRKSGIVDSIVFAEKIHPTHQTPFDRLRNYYIYFLSNIHCLRKLPIPKGIRGHIKSIFKKIISAAQ